MYIVSKFDKLANKTQKLRQAPNARHAPFIPADAVATMPLVSPLPPLLPPPPKAAALLVPAAPLPLVAAASRSWLVRAPRPLGDSLPGLPVMLVLPGEGEDSLPRRSFEELSPSGSSLPRSTWEKERLITDNIYGQNLRRIQNPGS